MARFCRGRRRPHRRWPPLPRRSLSSARSPTRAQQMSLKRVRGSAPRRLLPSWPSIRTITRARGPSYCRPSALMGGTAEEGTRSPEAVTDGSDKYCCSADNENRNRIEQSEFARAPRVILVPEGPPAQEAVSLCDRATGAVSAVPDNTAGIDPAHLSNARPTVLTDPPASHPAPTDPSSAPPTTLDVQAAPSPHLRGGHDINCCCAHRLNPPCLTSPTRKMGSGLIPHNMLSIERSVDRMGMTVGIGQGFPPGW